MRTKSGHRVNRLSFLHGQRSIASTHDALRDNLPTFMVVNKLLRDSSLDATLLPFLNVLIRRILKAKSAVNFPVLMRLITIGQLQRGAHHLIVDAQLAGPFAK